MHGCLILTEENKELVLTIAKINNFCKIQVILIWGPNWE